MNGVQKYFILWVFSVFAVVDMVAYEGPVISGKDGMSRLYALRNDYPELGVVVKKWQVAVEFYISAKKYRLPTELIEELGAAGVSVSLEHTQDVLDIEFAKKKNQGQTYAVGSAEGNKSSSAASFSESALPSGAESFHQVLTAAENKAQAPQNVYQINGKTVSSSEYQGFRTNTNYVPTGINHFGFQQGRTSSDNVIGPDGYRGGAVPVNPAPESSAAGGSSGGDEASFFSESDKDSEKKSEENSENSETADSSKSSSENVGLDELVNDATRNSSPEPAPKPAPEPAPKPASEPTTVVNPGTLDESLKGVQWSNSSADVSGWPIDPNVKIRGISLSKDMINFDMNDRNWPSQCLRDFFKAPATEDCNVSDGNAYIFVNLNGQWHGATWEWLRPNQKSKFKSAIGHGLKEGPLKGWEPKRGDSLYFMISGHARLGARTKEIRTNIFPFTWPE